MIQRSESLERALARETCRFAGSLATLVFYQGEVPADCNAVALGERVKGPAASEFLVRSIARGTEPGMPPGATYWRLYDANGNVVCQGTGDAVG